MAEVVPSLFERIAAEIGALTAAKNKAYGNSAEKSAKILAVLYPNGVAPAQFRDLLLVTRVLDKLSRISEGNAKAGGESAWRDVCGYGLLGCAMDEEGAGEIIQYQGDRPPRPEEIEQWIRDGRAQRVAVK